MKMQTLHLICKPKLRNNLEKNLDHHHIILEVIGSTYINSFLSK
jgi:hypothetical protein